jgi:hypothetical protein
MLAGVTLGSKGIGYPVVGCFEISSISLIFVAFSYSIPAS